MAAITLKQIQNFKKYKTEGSFKRRRFTRKRHYDKLIRKAIEKERIELLQESNLAKSFAQALAPKPDLTLTQWADTNRMLPQISAHESGLWRTSRFPFLKRIQDLLSPSNPCQQVVIMKGAQLGLTEIALNWMFYTIDYHPVPMLYVQKTLDNIKVFMAQRWDPAVDEMPTIKDKIGSSSNSQKTINTQRIKIFPGGMLRFGGANSASSLRSMPICYLVLDEEDSYEQDIQSEGSPSKLAMARTRNFPNRKIFRLSTPTLEETSIIDPLFKKGTREYFHVPCPHCNAMQKIEWNNIKKVLDEFGNISGAELACTHCACMIEEYHKTWMLERGKWIAENPGAPYPSFHLSSLYSPFGFYSWADAMREWYEAQSSGDVSLLKTFINTVLGEPWSASNKSVKASWLEKRKETYKAEVPKDVVLITSASDVQDNRIETEIIGWTRHRQSFSIDYKIHYGDTSQNEVWDQFDNYLSKWHLHESGIKMPKALSVIDAKYRTKIVHAFCKVRQHRNIYPINGLPGWGKGEVDRPTKKNKYLTFKFGLYVDELKMQVLSHLLVDDTDSPGYCHFPNKEAYNLAYYKSLTAERLTRVWSGGKQTLKWDLPKGRRNEALDLRVYNTGALKILNPDFSSLPVNQLYNVAFGKVQKKKRKVHSKGY